MRMIRYATASLIYHKKRTLFYTAVSSIFAFSLMVFFNLMNLQTTLYTQIKNRILYYDPSSKSIPSLDDVTKFYQYIVLLLLIGFAIFFSIYFSFLLKKSRKELYNWRLMGFSSGKLFLFVFWQLLLPLTVIFFLLLLWVIAFQPVYEALLQRINLPLLHVKEFHSITSNVIDGSGLTIPQTQQAFLEIDFKTDFLLTDTLKGINQTAASLLLCSFVISLLRFCLFYHTLEKRSE
jgi:hypothetical protein